VQPKGIFEEVAPDVFALVWSEDDSIFGGYGANQAFVVLENSVLIFDTGLSLLQARQLDEVVRKSTDKKIRYIVNSHDHSDHVFGNSYFWKRYSAVGLRIFSHQTCKDNLANNGPKSLARYFKVPGMKEHLESIEIREPNAFYPDLGFQVKVEGVNFVFSHPPTGAHTLGDTCIELPDKQILLAGDIVWNHFFPNLEDANLEGWISFIDGIDLNTYRKVVPGHGTICGPETVTAFRDYLRTVRSNLMKIDLSNIQRRFLRDFFIVPGTEDWKLRLILDHNVDTLFLRKSGR